MDLPSLEKVLSNIKDPHRWADSETILRVLEETPSVRGMVYGNFAEAMFADALVAMGVPVKDQQRDDDHAKTKSDRTFRRVDRAYTVQLKSMQTNSIAQLDDDTFAAKIQCDASDKRPRTANTCLLRWSRSYGRWTMRGPQTCSDCWMPQANRSASSWNEFRQ